MVNLPQLNGKDLSEFEDSFVHFLNMVRQTPASGSVKCDLLMQCCNTKYLEKQVKHMITKSKTFTNLLLRLEGPYATCKIVSIWNDIHNIGVLPNNPKATRISELLCHLDRLVEQVTPRSYGSDELLWLQSSHAKEVWDGWCLISDRKAGQLSYKNLLLLVIELAIHQEYENRQNACLLGGNLTRQGQGPTGYERPQQAEKSARYQGVLF